MKLATITRFSTSALLATSLTIVGIGCEEQTGSTINGGDPVPERVNPEPPYSPETGEPGIPQEPSGADAEPSPFGGTSEAPRGVPSESDSPPSDFPSAPAGSALEDTDGQ